MNVGHKDLSTDLPDLPVELLCLVADFLTLRSVVRLSSVCRRFYEIFRELAFKRLIKMPWSITFDFSRDRHHHIFIHKIWIKLGWFPNSGEIGLTQCNNSGEDHSLRCGGRPPYTYIQNLNSTRKQPSPELILDLYEFCDVCMITEDHKYVAIRNGIGFQDGHWPPRRNDCRKNISPSTIYDLDTVLSSILRHGRHPRVKISKGYLPHIIGLTNQDDEDGFIISAERDTIFLLGRDYPLHLEEESIQVGFRRVLRYVYNDYCLCESYVDM